MEKITIQQVKKDRTLMDAFIEENIPLVRMIIKKYIRYIPTSALDYDDFFQLGCIGLYNAVEGFDLDYGNQFSTYAFHKIKGEIGKSFRDYGMTSIKVSRTLKLIYVNYKKLKAEFKEDSEILKELNISQKELNEAIIACKPITHFETPTYENENSTLCLENLIGSYEFEAEIADRDLVNLIINKIQKLTTEKNFNVLRLNLNGLNQNEISREIGISQVQISRILKKINVEVIPEIMSSFN